MILTVAVWTYLRTLLTGSGKRPVKYRFEWRG
jgi:hypothetical protein